MPDALELQGVWRAVVPDVRSRRALVGELVADRLPVLAGIVGALHHLAEPTAGLGGVEPIGVCGRAFQVVDLPALEVGAVHFPVLPARVRAQNERAFARPNQYPYLAHAPPSSLIACLGLTRHTRFQTEFPDQTNRFPLCIFLLRLTGSSPR